MELRLFLLLLLLHLPQALEALRVSDQFKQALEVHLDALTAREFGSSTESDDFSSARVQHVTEEEYRRRAANRGLPPAEAERVFNAKLLKAISLAQRAQAKKTSVGETDQQTDLDQDQESDFWAGSREDLEAAVNATEDYFKREQFKKLMAGVSPNIHLYFCIHINVDLSLVPPYIPLLQMNVGFLGGLHIDTHTGCWGGALEVSAGFDWGFKVLGYTFGVGVSATGSIDFAEVPPARALADAGSTQTEALVYAPEGADLTKCHTRSPWPVLQTFWEHQVKKAFGSKEVREKVRNEVEVQRARVDEFKRIYAGLLGGPWALLRLGAHGDPEPGEVVVRAPRLVGPAIGMDAAVARFVSVVPSYATQVMNRIADNDRTSRGPDNERSFFHGNVLRRFTASNGRFLARWPSSGTLQDFDEDSEEGTNLASEVDGVTRSDVGADMRVINFAKVMRISRHRHDLSFWKELSMSASNLMIRTVSDVRALIATFLAGDPHWDGSCEALPISLDSADLIKGLQKKMQTFPWVSSSTRTSKRGKFAQGSRFSTEANHRIFPHLWCGLAQQGSDAAELASVERILGGGNFLELSVVQACETVVHELRDLEPEDEKIEWDEVTSRFLVKRGNETVGFLYGDGTDWHGSIPRHALGALEPVLALPSHKKGTKTVLLQALKKFRVASKAVESRPECERAHIPAPFVRLFPTFALAVVDLAAQIEELLLDTNACLDEVLNHEAIAESISRVQENRPLGDRQHACSALKKDAKLAYVRERALDILRRVRYMLLQLGAEDPRDSEKYRAGMLPVDVDEDALIKSGARSLVESLPRDFDRALGLREEAENYFGRLGLRVGRRVQVKYHKVLGTIEAMDPEGRPGASVTLDGDAYPASYQISNLRSTRSALVLSGYLWRGARELGSRLMENPEPLRRLSDGKRRLRPPVEFTNALSFTAQLSKNNFCVTPNTGLVMVSYVRQISWQTWSNMVSTEKCWMGRIRPGSVFINVMRCKGDNGGKDGDFGTYVDWRVRYQATLMKIDTMGTSGLIGNLLHGSHRVLETTLIEAGGLLGGALAGVAVERAYPHVYNSSALTGLLMLGASSTPMLGAAGVTTAMAIRHGSFHDVCVRFLQELASNGQVSGPGAAAETGWGVTTMLVVWGSVVHRQKTITLISGPSALGAIEPEAPKTFQRYHRLVSVHIENWNRISTPSIGLRIPGGLSMEVHAKLELDWDVTPWVERSMNRKLYVENRDRVQACAECLHSGKAFCDWRLPLGTLWSHDHDTCVEDTEEEHRRCTRENGVVDDLGYPVFAVFYSMSSSLSLTACDDITFPRANRELRLNDMLRRYLRRK